MNHNVRQDSGNQGLGTKSSLRVRFKGVGGDEIDGVMIRC